MPKAAPRGRVQPPKVKAPLRPFVFLRWVNPLVAIISILITPTETTDPCAQRGANCGNGVRAGSKKKKRRRERTDEDGWDDGEDPSVLDQPPVKKDKDFYQQEDPTDRNTSIKRRRDKNNKGKRPNSMSLMTRPIRMRTLIGSGSISTEHPCRHLHRWRTYQKKRRHQVTVADDELEAAIDRAVSLREAGELAGSESLLRDLVLKAPRSASGLHELGITLYTSKQFQAARTALNNALLLDERSWSTLLYLAMVCEQIPDLPAAVGYFERAIVEAGEYEDIVRSFYGEYFAARGEFENAEREFRASLALSPDFATAHRQVGRMLDFCERHEEAEVHLRRAVAIEPDRPLNLFCLGELLWKQKSTAEEGMRWLRRAAEGGSNRATDLIAQIAGNPVK